MIIFVTLYRYAMSLVKSQAEDMGDHPVMGYNYETQAVVDCIAQGLTECPTMPLSATANMMRLMDEMRHRIGLHYPFEKD